MLVLFVGLGNRTVVLGLVTGACVVVVGSVVAGDVVVDGLDDDGESVVGYGVGVVGDDV